MNLFTRNSPYYLFGFASELYLVHISGLWVLGTVKHNTILAATWTLLVTRLCWTLPHRLLWSDCTHCCYSSHAQARAITLSAKEMRAKRKRRKYLFCTVCSFNKWKLKHYHLLKYLLFLLKHPVYKSHLCE